MNNLSNKDRTRLCLIICLESINIDNNNIFSSTNKEFKNLTNKNYYNNVKIQNQSYYKKSLSTMQNILNSSKNRYRTDKMISILQYYSNKKKYSNIKFNSIFPKYIDRFAYKYTKYYKYNFINKDYKKNKSMKNISLIYIYLLYKTLHTNKKFYIYKDLNLQIDKLKPNFKF